MKFSTLLFSLAVILTFGAYMGAPILGLALCTQLGAVFCLALND